MITKEYILKILDRVEEIKPSEFVKWEAFKRFGVPKIRSFINGEVIKERLDKVIATPEDAEEIFEIK